MTTSINLLKRLFWNSTEQRLRTIWRLGLFVGSFIMLTVICFVILLFLAVMTDDIFGLKPQHLIAGLQPMQIMENPWVGSLVIPGAICMGTIAATFLIGKWIDRRRFIDFGFKFSKIWWKDFSFGIALGALLMGLIFLFGWITGTINPRGYFVSFRGDVSFAAGIIQSLLLYVFVGVYEEILFRGYLLLNLAEGLNNKILGKRWALVATIALTSLVFGWLHLDNPNATWVSTVNIAFAGIFLGLGMFLTGSLAIPIGLHISWNIFQGNVFGFPVSGMVNGATIIATESVGPAWLTGGAFGPEGGAFGLMAIILGSGLILLWVRIRGRLYLQTNLAVFEPVPMGNKKNPAS
ncbi:MAG: CPBP family intramembrane glutamic endopeptidase [Chloroflexota bacterium]|nr:CPBP family intramembrane glutamic endopeptidase [Chloroflexota bacterium]